MRDSLILLALAFVTSNVLAHATDQPRSQTQQAAIIFPKVKTCGDVMVGNCLRPDTECLAKEALQKTAVQKSTEKADIIPVSK